MNTRKRWIADITAWTVGLLASMVLIAQEAMAGGGLAVPPNKRWQAECGSCHVAYPPKLLPAASWKRLMSQLEQHFGTDASIDPAAATEIGEYLERYSASGRRVQGAAGSLRVTDTAWFLREHRDVPPAAWSHPSVKSAANCAACHTSAERGEFRERNVRLPG